LAILAHVTWPWAQPLDESILLQFSLETKLESESFETLIDFLKFVLKTLRSETVLFNLFVIMEPLNTFALVWNPH